MRGRIISLLPTLQKDTDYKSNGKVEGNPSALYCGHCIELQTSDGNHCGSQIETQLF